MTYEQVLIWTIAAPMSFLGVALLAAYGVYRWSLPRKNER